MKTVWGELAVRTNFGNRREDTFMPTESSQSLPQESRNLWFWASWIDESYYFSTVRPPGEFFLWVSFSETWLKVSIMRGFPGGASGKESTCQCRRRKRWFNLWVGKVPWWRKWQLVGYSPWGSQRVRHDSAYTHIYKNWGFKNQSWESLNTLGNKTVSEIGGKMFRIMTGG